MRSAIPRARHLIAAIILAATCWQAAAEQAAEVAAEASVSGIEIRQMDRQGVRLILRLSRELAFTTFTLTEPDRLVIDFPPVDWTLSSPEPPDPAQIADVRFGAFSPSRSRLILDLAKPMKVERAFTQPARGGEPALLIADLLPVERAAFDASAGAPASARWQGRRTIEADRSADTIVIAIDPGHGGIDPGASVDGILEKDVVLAFARTLAERLQETDGFAAVLTRDADEFVPLDDRVRRAHAAGAHAFLSLHADSVEAGSANGVSIYTLSRKGTDQAAENFAARENRSDLLAGADLSGEADDVARLLIELSQRGTDPESRRLARVMLEALEPNVPLLGSRPMRQANFRVLKAPDMPSILLELGFLDDPTDRARLTSPDWREQTARAVVAGLEAWKDVASPGFLGQKR